VQASKVPGDDPVERRQTNCAVGSSVLNSNVALVPAIDPDGPESIVGPGSPCADASYAPASHG
jgi:hypothetical protein